MKQLLYITLGSFLAGVVGWISNHWHRTRGAKDEFIILVQSLIDEIPEEKGFIAYFDKIKPDTRREVQKVDRFLWGWRRKKKVQSAWRTFQAIDANNLADQNQRYKMTWEAAAEINPAEIKNWKDNPSEILRSHLDELIKSVG